MSRIIRELREMWRPLDPADDCSLPDTGVREAGLRRILDAPLDGALPVDLPPRVGRLRRTVFAAAGAVAAGGVLVVANPAQGPSFASTPRPLVSAQAQAGQPAAPVLREIIARTSSLAPEQAGDIDWLRVQSWWMEVETSAEGFTTAITPDEEERRRHADGSGTITRTKGDPLPIGSLVDRVQAWWDTRDAEVRTETYGPGQFPTFGADAAERPPADPRQLRAWLMENAGLDEFSSRRVIETVQQLVYERVLTRDERAALLELLAGLPGLRYAGEVTERAGREGAAFVLDVDVRGL
ncbi:MAG TPA: CU044_5270 family protein, partial [Pilimelia sp.]|nr:CU044_5270 family protein [Pilimelia sp.]